MYHATKSAGIRQLLTIEAPSLIAAIVIANTFYKFGSFLLELLAFLPTWFILSFLLSLILGRTAFDDAGLS